MRNAQVFAASGGFVPARLTVARQAKGLKQKDLAEALSVRPATISKWEGDAYGHGPDQANIASLSGILSVSPEWFFRPMVGRTEPAFYRSMRSELSVFRDKAAAKLLFAFETFLQLEDLIEFPECDIPDLMGDSNYKTLSEERIEGIARRLREYWCMGDDPIIDLMVVLENAGIVVAETFIDSNKLDGVSTWFGGVPVMLLAKDKDGGVRRRFDAAHELGHLILHRGVTESELKADLKLIEEQAMLFAGSFLLPSSSFAVSTEMATLEHLAALKPRWGVSVGAMIKRLSTLNLVSESHATNLWKYYSYRQWRGNEPHDDHIKIERPESIRSALELLAAEDPTALREVVRNVGIDVAYIAELSGVEELTLDEAHAVRPKLKLVRTTAAND